MKEISGFAAGIVGCALLGATVARADPYVATIDQVGSNVVVTSNANGDFNLEGLTLGGGGFIQNAQIWASNPRLVVATNPISFYNGPISGDASFGGGPQVVCGGPLAVSCTSSGPAVGLSAISGGFQLYVPLGYPSEGILGPSTSTYNDTNFANLGLTLGTFRWTWGPAADQSFTINVVPGPIVGAGLPGLIAALGGLVAMARRRRKQLAA